MSCGSLSLLSHREQEVATLICNGLPNKLIANQLGLTVGTVKQHVHNILLKLKVHRRAQLIPLMVRPASDQSVERAHAMLALA
jgi:two-component system nitrate/nitrite response regulator NarL